MPIDISGDPLLSGDFHLRQADGACSFQIQVLHKRQSGSGDCAECGMLGTPFGAVPEIAETGSASGAASYRLTVSTCLKSLSNIVGTALGNGSRHERTRNKRSATRPSIGSIPVVTSEELATGCIRGSRCR